MQLIAALRAHRLMAIIRGRDPDACERTVAVLVDNGISLLEVSLTSTDAFGVIERVADRLRSRARRRRDRAVRRGRHPRG